jgi:predicted dehydrogenase
MAKPESPADDILPSHRNGAGNAIRSLGKPKGEGMLRIGMIDCDTSHVYAFSQRINHVGVEPEQWVDGARVVAAVVGTSRLLGPERVAEYVEKLKETGAELVDQPRDLMGRVDAVMVMSQQGGVHRERATPFLEAALPVWVNKPFASSVADALAMVDLATQRGATLISSSSLRFADEVLAARVDESLGPPVGADVYTPAHLHDSDPGLFHYGVHGVEMLYTFLGTGCREVTCVFEEGSEVVVGRWGDGRLGTVRGLRGATIGYGFTLFGERGITSTPVGTETIYRNMLAAVVPVLAGSPSPISSQELVEVVAFQEAALASRNSGGRPVAVTV